MVIAFATVAGICLAKLSQLLRPGKVGFLNPRKRQILDHAELITYYLPMVRCLVACWSSLGNALTFFYHWCSSLDALFSFIPVDIKVGGNRCLVELHVFSTEYG